MQYTICLASESAWLAMFVVVAATQLRQPRSKHYTMYLYWQPSVLHKQERGMQQVSR